MNRPLQGRTAFTKLVQELFYIEGGAVQRGGRGEVEREDFAVEVAQGLFVVGGDFGEGGVEGALFAGEGRHAARMQVLPPTAQTR